MLSFKFSFEQEVRRVQIKSDGDCVKFQDICVAVKRIFPHLNNEENLNLVWLDEDNDSVSCSSDDELSEAMRVLSSQNKIYRFEICLSRSTIKTAHNEEPKSVHIGVRCDICNIGPIIGNRFKCTVRENFDLCSTCESSKVSPYPLIKIVNPNQAPTTLFVALPDENFSHLKHIQKSNVKIEKSEKKVERKIAKAEKKIEKIDKKKTEKSEKKAEKNNKSGSFEQKVGKILLRCGLLNNDSKAVLSEVSSFIDLPVCLPLLDVADDFLSKFLDNGTTNTEADVGDSSCTSAVLSSPDHVEQEPLAGEPHLPSTVVESASSPVACDQVPVQDIELEFSPKLVATDSSAIGDEFYNNVTSSSVSEEEWHQVEQEVEHDSESEYNLTDRGKEDELLTQLLQEAAPPVVPAPTPALVQAREAVWTQVWAKELGLLADMGFRNTDVCLRLLQTHVSVPVSLCPELDGVPIALGMQRVVAILLQNA